VTCDQTQCSAALCIDQEQSGNGEDNLDGTIAKRCVKSLIVGVFGLCEDSRTVERDDCELSELHMAAVIRTLTVNTAHLLGDHNGRGTVVGSSDTRYSEAISQTGEVSRSTSDLELLLVDNVRVVVISCANDGMRTQSSHRLETLSDFSVLHQPTRRFGAEENTAHQNERWDEGRSKLETPCDARDIFDDDVCAEAEENTCEQD